MTVLSDHQLFDAGLMTDEISGFRAVMSNPKIKTEHIIALSPDHFKGLRIHRFERGGQIAKYWLVQRNAAGRVRRRHRAEERARTGAMTVIDQEAKKIEAIEMLHIAIKTATPRRNS